uniref:Uncharacterized protein n=1 Tax=Mola mola TaxID=94237 RepID=A0A3Q3XH99_MOLML
MLLISLAVLTAAAASSYHNIDVGKCRLDRPTCLQKSRSCFPSPGKHHLRPPVSHCCPAGSWGPFSTQMSVNKEKHVQERERQGGGGGGCWSV